MACLEQTASGGGSRRRDSGVRGDSASGRGLHCSDSTGARIPGRSQGSIHSPSLSPERQTPGGQGESIDQLQSEIRRLRKAVDEAHLEKVSLSAKHVSL